MRFKIIILFLFFVLVLQPGICEAVMFSNMGAGGRMALEAQKMSSEASATFYKAAAAAFEMFGDLELVSINNDRSLNQAKKFAEKSRYLLGLSLRQFETISEMGDALSAVNRELQKVNNYDQVFEEAAVFLDSQTEKKIENTAKKEGAQGLLKLSIDTIKDLLAEESPMGKVYKEILYKKLPKEELLWGAGEQWDKAFQTGRIISSFFKARK